MLRASRPGLMAVRPDGLLPTLTLEASPGAAITFAAFCQHHWPLYLRYARAVTGNATHAPTLAHAALCEVGAQWPTVLRSTAPPAAAWRLLRATTASRRTHTTQVLHRSMDPQQADAFLLSYRLGLTPAQGGCAMGVTPGTFVLLRRSALRTAAQLDWRTHMPMSHAL